MLRLAAHKDRYSVPRNHHPNTQVCHEREQAQEIVQMEHAEVRATFHETTCNKATVCNSAGFDQGDVIMRPNKRRARIQACYACYAVRCDTK